MDTNVIFLFLILLLGVVILYFLGNMDKKEGLTNTSANTNQSQQKSFYSSNHDDFYGSGSIIFPNGTIFTDINGNIITVGANKDGRQNLKLQYKVSKTQHSLNPISQGTSNTVNKFSSDSGAITATIIIGEDGQPAIKIKNGINTSIFSQIESNSNPENSSNIFDNYNHFNGSGSSVTLQNGTFFTDANGNTITVGTNSNGTQNLQLQLASADAAHVFHPTSQSSTNATSKFTSASGGITATAFKGNDGQTAIRLQNGNTTSIFLQPGSTTNSQNQIKNTQYYGSTGYSVNPTSYTMAYTNTQPTNTNYGTTYYSTLPKGIPQSQIPPGQEDLYILKSQIVPPVCPVCPACANSYSKSKSNSNSNSDNEYGSNGLAGSAYGDKKCPPCPACERCPESAFECKKVPNYNAVNNDYLPQPVLSDFSQFGM